MENSISTSKGVLLLAAGIKGAIGTTLAAAVQVLRRTPDRVLPYLMTNGMLPVLGPSVCFELAGWDVDSIDFPKAFERHGVLDTATWSGFVEEVKATPFRAAPDVQRSLADQIKQIRDDMQAFISARPGYVPVLVNLLPAGRCQHLDRFAGVDDILAHAGEIQMPDLAYALAAIQSGVPVVNFSPNEVDVPALVDLAAQKGVPIAGRDGKTGQTYFKMVLASAMRARKLQVNGWYSLNILGNADGRNLMSPAHAACKLDNKTGLLEDILGYVPGQKAYGVSSHKVHIDYYAPRGDAKEAWDVIDFAGLFHLPMSLRLDLLGRDSILAAPLVLDLARWMAALTIGGRAGAVPELAFYFKKSIGERPPKTFQDQLQQIKDLKVYCDRLYSGRKP